MPLYCSVCVRCTCCSRMEESTPPSSSSSKSVLVLSPVATLVKRDQCGELVLSPWLPVQRRRREGEELVCGSISGLTDRQTDRQSTLAEFGSVWSEKGKVQESARAVQHKFHVKEGVSVCLEPHLPVDSDSETNAGGVQETRQT